jgi:hypothetical protein
LEDILEQDVKTVNNHSGTESNLNISIKSVSTREDPGKKRAFEQGGYLYRATPAVLGTSVSKFWYRIGVQLDYS